MIVLTYLGRSKIGRVVRLLSVLGIPDPLFEFLEYEKTTSISTTGEDVLALVRMDVQLQKMDLIKLVVRVYPRNLEFYLERFQGQRLNHEIWEGSEESDQLYCLMGEHSSGICVPE